MSKHRHLVLPPDLAPDAMPSVAVVDLLERGDLEAWRPLLVAIRNDPLGPFAERIVRLLDEHPMYGTSPLLRAFVDRQRARHEGPLHASPPATLDALRREDAVTQTRLASALDMSQSDLSKFERRDDVRLSNLRAYVQALGGRLLLVFARGNVRRTIRVGRE